MDGILCSISPGALAASPIVVPCNSSLSGLLPQQGAPLGEATGVWVGIQQMEYGGQAAAHLPALGAFTATGTPFSVAAGRISFTHGFRGPAVRQYF